MWNRRIVMLADEVSFPAAGPMCRNYEWLSGGLFYSGYRLGGLPGLIVLDAGVITSAVTISWRLMAGAPLQRLVFLAAAITAIAPVWTVRPHVFTLLLLMSIVRFGMRERYWPLPLIFCA